MAVNSINLATGQVLTAPTISYNINAQTGSTYTAVLGDAAAFVTMNNASANTFYVPTNASVAFALGTTLNLFQIGDGATTITAVTPATTKLYVASVNGGAYDTGGTLRMKYSGASIVKIATDGWMVIGDVY